MDNLELKRLKKLCFFENEARRQGYRFIAGIDEAGRGPLAGPVFAAACVIPADLFIPGIDDSKKLSPKKREEIFQRIIDDDRIAYGIAMVEASVIDQINIFQATIQAMLLAIDSLSLCPDLLLVDGLKLPHATIPTQKIIGGDALSFLIAAASILAKVSRDRLMCKYHEQWPEYGFDEHKGYPPNNIRKPLPSMAHVPFIA